MTSRSPRSGRTGNCHLCAKRKGFGYGVDGAFTDFVKVPRRCLHRLPDHVPFDHGCVVECACVAYQALVVLSRIRPGDPVLVIGPGPIGLLSAQLARICGASPVMLTGRNPKRLDVARELGIDNVIDYASEDPAAVVMETTGGRGVPLVVDTAGNSGALKLAIDMVARRGQIMKIGWGPQAAGCTLDPLLAKAARLQGTFSHTWETWEAVIGMIAKNLIRIDPLITHRFTLDRWHDAFVAVEEREAVKAVMEFGV